MRTRFLNLRIPTGDNVASMREIVVENGRFVDLLPPELETAVKALIDQAPLEKYTPRDIPEKSMIL